MRTFHNADVVRALGISQRVLCQWIYTGLVRPNLKARGPGNRHEFIMSDIVRISLMMRLSNLGLARDRAATIAFCPPAREAGKDLFEDIQSVITSYKNELESKAQGHWTIAGGPHISQVYLGFIPISDDPGYVARGFHITDSLESSRLYSYLAEIEVAFIINLSLLVKGVMDVLGTE